MKRYEELEHTADWAFRAYGHDLPDLFQNAAYALFALEGAIDMSSTITRAVHVTGIDYESLLVNWLSELIFLQETQAETYQRFDISQLTPQELVATIHGAPAFPENKLVKAVTYHDSKIERTPDGWQAVVIVDV